MCPSSSVSTALLADSVDMLGDAIIYGFSFYVVSRGSVWQARAGLLKGAQPRQAHVDIVGSAAAQQEQTRDRARGRHGQHWLSIWMNSPSSANVSNQWTYRVVTLLFAFVGTRIVGRVSIRHSLNPFLERVGGHIGYVVVPQGQAATPYHLSAPRKGRANERAWPSGSVR